jgi:hypothetical protein
MSPYCSSQFSVAVPRRCAPRCTPRSQIGRRRLLPEALRVCRRSRCRAPGRGRRRESPPVPRCRPRRAIRRDSSACRSARTPWPGRGRRPAAGWRAGSEREARYVRHQRILLEAMSSTASQRHCAGNRHRHRIALQAWASSPAVESRLHAERAQARANPTDANTQDHPDSSCAHRPVGGAGADLGRAPLGLRARRAPSHGVENPHRTGRGGRCRPERGDRRQPPGRHLRPHRPTGPPARARSRRAPRARRDATRAPSGEDHTRHSPVLPVRRRLRRRTGRHPTR